MVREGLRGVEGAVEVDISKIHCICLGNSQRKKYGKKSFARIGALLRVDLSSVYTRPRTQSICPKVKLFLKSVNTEKQPIAAVG